MVWIGFSCSEDGTNIYNRSSMSPVSTPLLKRFEKIDCAHSKDEDIFLVVTTKTEQGSVLCEALPVIQR